MRSTTSNRIVRQAAVSSVCFCLKLIPRRNTPASVATPIVRIVASIRTEMSGAGSRRHGVPICCKSHLYP